MRRVRVSKMKLLPVVVAAFAVVTATTAVFGWVGDWETASADPVLAAYSAPDQALPPPAKVLGMEVVGHNDLGQEVYNTSDVWLLNETAYLGYRCGEDKGTSFVDVSDPTNPTVIFQTEVMSRTFTDDIFAITMDTASFEGDILVEPHDRCGEGPPAATRIWDVRDSSAPVLLSTMVHGDGVHNVNVFQRGENAYIILAAPWADINDNTNAGYEDIDLDADFVIVDITNPRSPTIVSRWSIHDELTNLPPDPNVFMHDVWTSADHTRAWGAYWDAGIVELDISDPSNPVFVSRLSYLDVGSGNAHLAVPTKNEDYLVIADEDFAPTSAEFEVTEPAALAGIKPSSAGRFLDVIAGQPKVGGELVWVGRGCSVDPAYPEIIVDDPYLNPAVGKVAVILRGGCSFANKILRAQNEGAIAAVIVNNVPGGPPGMGGGDSAITIPATGIGSDDGNAITTTLETGTIVRATMGIVPGEWGFTRIADYTDRANPRLVAEFTIPETRMFPPADGTWTVHNPWVVGDDLYLSHYSGGVRVVDISNPRAPRERAFMIPASRPMPDGSSMPSDVWGVVTDGAGYIYLSDMVNGLWIVRETGPEQPTEVPTTVPTTAPTTAPTIVPTDIPPVTTPTPIPTPGGAQVCPQIVRRVPAAAIQAALANPADVAGYQQLLDPSKPAGPYNPMRTMLSMRQLSKPYHPTFNGLEFKAGCP